MKLRALQFILIGWLAIHLNGCYSWHISDSKPDKRYIASRDGEAYFSFLAPEGRWRVFHRSADTQARYSFGANLNPYVYYDVTIKINRIKLPERVANAKDIMDRGDYQKYLDDELYSEQFKRNSKIAGDQNVYGKLITVAGLQCDEIGWDNHHGPSPDSWDPEFAGLGFYKKEYYISCPLRKGDQYRWLSIYVFFNISDKHLTAEDRHKYNLTPDLIAADLRWRLQRTFDSFDFYGFSQD